MLWNWYTIDACFLARSWHITSRGMFAGSCIGVILLVMLLEFFRRLAKEYDRFLSQGYKREQATRTPLVTARGSENDNCPKNVTDIHFRPTALQQMTRALLHTIQFTIAYFVMLLAMYYNGYIIICIFIGAYAGSFIFSWETISLEYVLAHTPLFHSRSLHCVSLTSV
ncbi:Ctr copper transporter [Glonium stellatum]|uniref:Copper transport protein n=1 Tax=Glonium stellatum TaxID=574774 RepID=A0A8E2ES08_9PEZI|nr:Ctr copper transporter [Glonium stellatum]